MMIKKLTLLSMAFFFSCGTLLAEEKSKKKSVPKVSTDHVKQSKEGLELFKKHVRPIFLKSCLECHGGKSVKSDFDLATRKKLMESGWVEKTAEESYLISLLTHEEKPFMPFKKPKLSKEEIGHIQRWIDLGAPYDKPLVEQKDTPSTKEITENDRKFWSFLPLKTGDLPEVKDREWCRTSIDYYIRSKQESLNLHPNKPAEKRILIRRAYFDLIGLPPSPAEVEAFLNDDDPNAYEKVIDRLLASEHFGERWARHWLDVVRFAESHGYEQDYNRNHAYHYRDFVIRAFNQDMPFDQFVRWQLAGDELAPEEPLAMMATGFIGAGAFPTQLTEAEFESARYDELDDIVSTMGVSFLGLSIGCARCHDHKYDPIHMMDYYRLAANFSTTIRSEVDLDFAPEETRKHQQEHEAKLTKLKEDLDRYQKEQLPGKLKQWLATTSIDNFDHTWTLPEIQSVSSSGKTVFEKQSDDSWLAKGTAPPQETITITAKTRAKRIATLRLEALTDASLPRKGPGRAHNGNFALGDLILEVRPLNSKGAFQRVKWSNAVATHQQNQDSLSIKASIDNDSVSGWAVDAGGIGKDQAANFITKEPVEFPEGTELKLKLVFHHPNKQHALGRFRISLSDQVELKPQVGTNQPNPKIQQAITTLKEKFDINSPEHRTLLDWYASRDPDWNKKSQAYKKLKSNGPPKNSVKVQVCSEGFKPMKHHADGRGFPHFYPKTYLLNRGDIHQKEEEVVPGYLRVLMKPGSKVSYWKADQPENWNRTSFRRASLANWMTDTESGTGHLVARVIVNRLWQHHFGKGIVATPNDFGFQGEVPTYPELLDWLAADLISHGWKLKRLHKLMMMSSVYLQSGVKTAANLKIDRENRFLWYRPPRRLEAEAIRDSMLSVAGELDSRMYGPGSLDQNMKRRSIYFFIKRSQLIPMMMLFDWPEHLVSIGARSQTTVAPQALMFMNSPQGRQYAEAFAKRISSEKSDRERIEKAYRLAYSRRPHEKELELTLRFVKQQQALYQKQATNSANLLALTDLCQSLLSSNEFVYSE